jgi:hypothetical protein
MREAVSRATCFSVFTKFMVRIIFKKIDFSIIQTKEGNITASGNFYLRCLQNTIARQASKNIGFIFRE